MQIPLLFEDSVLLVINKPAGVVVNRAQSVKGETVQDWVEQSLQMSVSTTEAFQSGSITEEPYNIVEEFRSRSGIVHRIDKETSGILVIAKTPEAFATLKQQFMERSVKKSYRAIIHGTLPSMSGEINAPIDRLPWNKELFGVVPSGKESLTFYKTVATYSRKTKHGKEMFQLVECFPKTGRTHQIRVHLKYLQRPIVGDYLYAGRKTARDDRSWVPRVMLHAQSISFLHPSTLAAVNIEAPLPEDMQQVLDQLTLEERV